MSKSNLKKHLNAVSDMKDFLKQHLYTEKRPDFEKIWDKYRDFAGEMKQKEQIRPFFRSPGFQAVSILTVFVVLIALLWFNRISFINRADSGRLFMVSLTSGGVEFQQKGPAKWEKLNTERPLKEGDILRSGDNGFCEIQVMDRTFARIENKSELTVDRITGPQGKFNVRLVLKNGQVFIKQKSLKEGESFQIETPAALVSIIGTKFMVKTDNDGNTEAAVSEGRIKITILTVKPGEKTSVIELSAGESVVIFNTNKKYHEELFEKGKIAADIKNNLDRLSAENIIKNLDNAAVLNIGSAPDGAEVFLNGSFAGHTPLRVMNSIGSSLEMKIIKNGFEDYILKNYTVNNSADIKAVLMENSKSGPDSNNILTNTGLEENIPGALIWNKPISLPLMEKEAAVYEGNLYIADGNILKIISTNGILIKSIKASPEKSVLTRPVIDRGRIYAGSDKGGIYAYSPEGGLLWFNSEAGRERYSASPAAAFGLIAVPSIDKGIMVFDSGGKLLDSIVLKKDESVYSTPLILNEGSILVYGTEKGDIIAYDLKNKKDIWKISPVNDRIVFPLMGNDRSILVFYRAGGTILSVNPIDGSILWRKEVPELSRTAFSPVFSEGRAAFAADTPSGAFITIMDALSGKEGPPLRLYSPLASFTFGGRNLFIALKNNTIYSYDIAGHKYEWLCRNILEPAFITSDRNGVYAISPEKISKIKR